MIDQDTINTIISIATGVVPSAASIIALAKTTVKEKKWKKTQEIALESMSTVETWSASHPMSSEQKLQMALDATEASVKACGLTWDDEVKENVSTYINDMCSWSKTVNKN